ncbi:MAG: ABC transporter ATP-binding protein [Anaerolineales bacterium]|nr:ABC transporter ATP-binding protein [Anaerolineales bacterium]
MPAFKIELRHVSKAFHEEGLTLRVLEDISFGVPAGEFVTLLGPSGSGKSTLFNLLVGLLEPDAGEIVLEGNAAGPRLGRVGYMPQRDLLLPWRTVLDNVILPLELRGMPQAEAREQAHALLPRFGLSEFATAYPAALSGGLRQRAALLRTLLSERDVLLLDEPFGALDALTRRELQDWLLELWAEFKPTVLFITHDVEEALYLADRVIVLSARPGRVAATHMVQLPRPRQRGMITWPEFGQQEAELLRALGVTV